MGNQALLGGLVVVGGHHQHGIGSHFAGGLGVVDDMLGIVGAGAGNDGNTACNGFYHEADNLFLFLILNGGVFAGGTHNHQSVDSVFNLEFDEAAEGFVVNGAVNVHGGNQCGSHAGKNGVLHISFLLLLW